MKIVGVVWQRIVDSFAFLGIAMILFLALAIAYDVTGRNLIPGISAPWIIEVTKVVLLGFTFFACPWILRRRGHVTFDLVVDLLPKQAKRVFIKIGLFISLLSLLALSFYSYNMMIDAMQRGIYEINVLKIPRWLFFFSILVGSVFTVIEIIRQILGSDSNNSEQET